MKSMLWKTLTLTTFLFPLAVLGLEGSTDITLLVDKPCEKYGVIEGVKYCIQESSITLNSCGKQSDWPCMEEDGCLNINRWVLNDEKS
jgi:hypothetical protein